MRPVKPILIGLAAVGALGAVLVPSAFGGAGAAKGMVKQSRAASGIVHSGDPLAVGRLTITINPRGVHLEHAIPANFAVEPGVPLTVTFINRTTSMHTFTIPKLGISALIQPGSRSTPRVTRVTITVHEFGVFSWYCAFCTGVHPDSMPMRGKVYAIIGRP